MSKAGGAKQPPLAQLSLGEHALSVTGEAHFGRARASRAYTRETYYLDNEERDFDPDLHRPTRAQLASLRTRDLRDFDATHIDAFTERYGDNYDEREVRAPEEAPENMAQFAADLRTPYFKRGFAGRIRESDSAARERVRRAAALERNEHNYAGVQQQMQRHAGNDAFERLRNAHEARRAERQQAAARRAAAADRSAQDSDDDDDNSDSPPVPPALLAGEDVAAAEPHQCTAADLASLMPVDPLGNLPHGTKVSLLELTEFAAIWRALQPHLFVDERDKQHVNLLELCNAMCAAGAKFCDIARVSASARIGEALDSAHYGAFVDPRSGALRGGHEHFDARRGRTTLLIVSFRFVRRAKKSNEAAAAAKAALASRRGRRKGTDVDAVLEQAAEEPTGANTVRGERGNLDDDDGSNGADEYEDEDDDYDGGQDIRDPSRYFAYRVDVVLVEAHDHAEANETRAGLDQPSAPRPDATDSEASGSYDDDDDDSATALASDAASLDLFAPVEATAGDVDGDADSVSIFDPLDGANAEEEQRIESEIMPTGRMELSHKRACEIAGKFRARLLMTWCNSGDRPPPLCLRAFRIST